MFDFQQAHGFIFDCDGTLLDTLGAWEDAERDLFAQAGPLTDEQEDELHSAPIEEASRMFFEKYGVLSSAQAVLDHLDGHLLPFYRDIAEPLPGAVELVKHIASIKIPCVVLSSSPRRYLEAGLSHAGILDCFDELVTTDETGCSKQDAKIYERALSILGSARDKTWAIDDAPYAIRVMGRFGLNTIAPLNGCSIERETRLRASATLVVSTLQELL